MTPASRLAQRNVFLLLSGVAAAAAASSLSLTPTSLRADSRRDRGEPPEIPCAAVAGHQRLFLPLRCGALLTCPRSLAVGF